MNASEQSKRLHKSAYVIIWHLRKTKLDDEVRKDRAQETLCKC